MQIVKIDDVQKKDFSEQSLFEGGKVYAQFNFLEGATNNLKIGVMTFEPGATTKMHTHDFEQILYVIAGKAKVATEKEEHVLTPGTFVFFSPGERHAHGATEDDRFVQLTVMNPGKATQMHKE
jgi:quercetin dioxygenase-like cupin family protein